MKQVSKLSWTPGFFPPLDFENVNSILKPKSFYCSAFEVLHTFSTYLYYLGIFPYKIRLGPSPENKGIQLVTTTFRQASSLGIHILCSLMLVIQNRFTLSGLSIQSDPEKLFRIGSMASFLLNCILFSRICFRREHGLPNLLKVTHSFHDPRKLSNTKIKMTVMAFCTLVLINPVVRSVKLFDFSTPTLICKATYAKLDLASLLSFGGSQGHLDLCSSNVGSVVFLVMHIFLNLSVTVVATFSDAFIVINVTAVYLMTKDFLKLVDEDGYSGWSDLKKVSLHYHQFKSLMEEFNGTIGMLMLVYSVSAIPFFSSNFLSILDGGSMSLVGRIIMFYYLGQYLVVLTLAAEIHRKMEGFPDYFYEHFSDMILRDEERKELRWFVNEVSSTQIGLKGHGFFTITYSFLGNIVGAMITYMIIILQFQTSAGRKS